MNFLAILYLNQITWIEKSRRDTDYFILLKINYLERQRLMKNSNSADYIHHLVDIHAVTGKVLQN